MIYKNNSAEAIAELERQRLDGSEKIIPEKACTCESCGSEIYDGEDCLPTSSGIFCRTCVTMMTSEDVVSLLGHEFIAADKNKFECGSAYV